MANSGYIDAVGYSFNSYPLTSSIKRGVRADAIYLDEAPSLSPGQLITTSTSGQYQMFAVDPASPHYDPNYEPVGVVLEHALQSSWDTEITLEDIQTAVSEFKKHYGKIPLFETPSYTFDDAFRDYEAALASDDPKPFTYFANQITE